MISYPVKLRLVCMVDEFCMSSSVPDIKEEVKRKEIFWVQDSADASVRCIPI